MATSLYERLGGEQGIDRIVGDLLAFHLKNPVIQKRFEHADLANARRMGTQFFCAGSGGPQAYTGKDMRKAHAGMNISGDEFVAMLDDALAALEKNQIDKATKDEVLGILYSLKNEVVRQ